MRGGGGNEKIPKRGSRLFWQNEKSESGKPRSNNIVVPFQRRYLDPTETAVCFQFLLFFLINELSNSVLSIALCAKHPVFKPGLSVQLSAAKFTDY